MPRARMEIGSIFTIIQNRLGTAAFGGIACRILIRRGEEGNEGLNNTLDLRFQHQSHGFV